MLTACITALTLSGCDAARRFLDRSSRRETEYLGGHVRLKALWNEGAGFGLPVSRKTITAVSTGLLAGLWWKRRKHPVSTGLLLGGGLSNLLERLDQGMVYDYVQFPTAPGKLKNYVFNLADFAILFGGVGLALRKTRK
jgi:lipoprotein signal peptidase